MQHLEILKWLLVKHHGTAKNTISASAKSATILYFYRQYLTLLILSYKNRLCLIASPNPEEILSLVLLNFLAAYIAEEYSEAKKTPPT
jgi:hypothetical protein